MWPAALSRFAPWLALGAIAYSTSVFGWGYMKGSDAAEVRNLKLIEKMAKRDRKTVLADAEVGKHEAEIRYRIIERVNTVPSGGCTFSPECLQFYSSIVRAANTGGQDAGD